MIPKNIFQSWKTKYENLHPILKARIDAIKSNNPEYKYQLYDDNDIDEFVNTYYPGEIADCYNKLNIIVAKVDFWRYLVLYKYGGVYLDFDSGIEKPLNELITENDTAIITAEGNPGVYVQWGLIFSAGHPILKKVIDITVDNIKNKRYAHDIMRLAGPISFTLAINTLFMERYGGIYPWDKMKNTNSVFDKIPCRLFGIDFNGYLSFKHTDSNLLYTDTVHWMAEQRIKSIYKD